MKVLVTGATGLLGNNLARQLLDRGDAVRVLVRRTSDRRTLDGLDVEAVEGDITDSESIQRASRGMDAVIHNAAYIHIGWKHWDLGQRVNVEGTRHVALAARAAGMRMVHVSTVDTMGVGAPGSPADEESPRTGKPPCCYVATKREAEAVVLGLATDGLNAVVVNPGFMLGPWDWKPSSGRMLVEVARRFTPATPSGGCSVCDVRDVAAGILAALERGTSGRNYILAGENLTYFELWSLFAEMAGRRQPLFRLRPFGPFIAGRAGDLWGALTGNEPTVNSAIIKMSRLFHFYSSQRAIGELGYHFRPAREAIEAAWQWFVEHGYLNPTRA